MTSSTARRSAAPWTLPTAVAGSIAVTLSGLPAAAADGRADGAGERPDAPITASITGENTRATPTPTVVGAAASAASYTVVAGDTVSGIAARHGLRTNDVLAWNGLTRASVIHPGQVLQLSGAVSVASPTPAPAPLTQTHTVAGGDTLWAIARAHGVSVAALRSANGLDDGAVIHPGQVLALPLAASAAAAVAPAAPAPSVPAAAPSRESHTVAPGDTLWAVATSNGTSLAALLAANGLSESSVIYPGQVLEIPASGVEGLDAEQIANARIIIQVGRERGIPDRGIAIALATAMVESWIRNLDWGDRDSLGLFQQRPSTGWGTEAQVRDPHRAAAAFYGGSQDPNGTNTRGLLDVAGWESMAFTDAAQAVQVSAFPDRYGPWETQAYAWLAALG